MVLVDDGELEDVRSLLDELEVSYTRLQGREVKRAFADAVLLLVTTFARALSLEGSKEPQATRDQAFRIAIGDKGPESEREALRRAGLDFLAYRPVDLSLLRLLLLCGLYRGEERRQTTRRPIGSAAPFGLETRRAGSRGRDSVFFQPRRGLLAEISAQGCRIVGGAATAEPGRRVWVELPGEVAGGGSARAYGRIVRVDWKLAEDSREEEASIGVRFEKLGRRALKHLQRLLAPVASKPHLAGAPTRPRSPEPPPAKPPPRRRERRAARVVYGGEIVAMNDGVNVLVGRDLSPEGMRVEKHPMLALGDRVRLSICVADEGPVFVNASAVRDYGEAGVMLRFEAVEPSVRAKLDSLMRGLPEIESLGPRRDGAILLTEIVPRPEREEADHG